MSEKALDLSPYLGKARDRIYKVGIELEGGWLHLPKGAALTRDTSVHVSTDICPHVGELPSLPLDVKEFPVWLKKYYPYKVDKSCGLHVHVSLISATNYQRLMDPSIFPTTVKYIEEWAYRANLPPTHPIWERLRGENDYVQHTFYADQQVVSKRKDYDRHVKGHRYTLWNFPYARTGTAECRLLPMMKDHELATSAIQELLRITNAFLLAQAKRDKKVSAKVLGDEAVEREEVIEVM